MRLTEIKTVRKPFLKRLFSKVKTHDVEIREIEIKKIEVSGNQKTIYYEDTIPPGTKLKIQN